MLWGPWDPICRIRHRAWQAGSASGRWKTPSGFVRNCLLDRRTTSQTCWLETWVLGTIVTGHGHPIHHGEETSNCGITHRPQHPPAPAPRSLHTRAACLGPRWDFQGLASLLLLPSTRPPSPLCFSGLDSAGSGVSMILTFLVEPIPPPTLLIPSSAHTTWFSGWA